MLSFKSEILERVSIEGPRADVRAILRGAGFPDVCAPWTATSIEGDQIRVELDMAQADAHKVRDAAAKITFLRALRERGGTTPARELAGAELGAVLSQAGADRIIADLLKYNLITARPDDEGMVLSLAEGGSLVLDVAYKEVPTPDPVHGLGGTAYKRNARPCATCGRPGHRPDQHAGWTPDDERRG